MLDKLKLSKILIILLVLSACKVMTYSTEIICPNGLRVMVKFARKDAVAEAIQNAALAKKRQGTGENYTAIRLRDKRSLKIDKISPEDALQCKLRESEYGRFSRSYIKKYAGI